MDIDPNILNEIVALSKDDPKFEEKCVTLANSIKGNVHAITQLIEDLGPLLTNTIIDDREKGTLILSLILKHIPNDILNAAQLNYVCTFYSDRLNDHHQVVPAVIKGLTPLVNSKNIPDGLSTQLITSLFQYVPCQQQQQLDRCNIYQFIKAMLDKRKEELKAMGLDLVYGIISAIDGERDPRNLMFLFKWLPDFLKSIELGQLTEEMFDVMSCYFPVDFRPSDQDENTISRESLGDALCPCLCALPSFAELCIPLALEKLETELYIAKLDSLNLLIEGCKNFPLDIYKRHATQIWSLIQKEILSTKARDDRELQERCLLALTTILRKLSGDVEFTRNTTKDIIDTLKGNLRPDAALFVPSTKLIRAISQASSLTAELVFKETCSLFINLYNITATPAHKAVVLKQLVDHTITYISSSNTNIDCTGNLELVPNICLRAVVDTDTEARMAGVYNFATLAPYTTPSTRNYFYENLSMLITLKQEPEVRKAIMISLKIYARLYHEEIQDMLEKAHGVNGLESLKLYLEAVGCVVCVAELMPFALSILIENSLKPLETSIIALKILQDVLHEEETTISKYLNEERCIVEKLVDHFLRNLDYLDIDVHKDYLNYIAKIFIIILRYLDVNSQELVIREQLEKIRLFKRVDLKMIIQFGLFTSLKPDTKIPVSLEEILDVTMRTDSSYICTVGSQLLANIINKTADEDTLRNYLNCIEVRCNDALSTNQQPNNVIEIITFITKALAIRSSHYMSFWTTKLINLSANHSNAAKGFQIILDDNYECTSQKSYCKRTLLYKQKFFVEVCNFLISNYEEGKKHYLVILGYLFQNIPQRILKLELKKIIRLTLLCLSYCEEIEVLIAVLKAVNTLIENKDELAEDYMQEFLKYYSKLATFEKSMQIRLLALKGIQLYSTYPLYKLLPLKLNILAILGNCLDDKKRLVRKEAVEARSKWFLIDAPM